MLPSYVLRQNCLMLIMEHDRSVSVFRSIMQALGILI